MAEEARYEALDDLRQRVEDKLDEGRKVRTAFMADLERLLREYQYEMEKILDCGLPSDLRATLERLNHDIAYEVYDSFLERAEAIYENDAAQL